MILQRKALKPWLLIGLAMLIASSAFAQTAPLAVKVAQHYPSTTAYVMGSGEQLSGQQFQTDGILTYMNYQYAVYYNATRNVTIARRKMPVGVWEEVVLPYRNSANDAHNTISMGISAGDGRIHLSYDHHNDPLHYCHSIAGSANDPENMPWATSSFSATTNILDKAVPDVTYPRFISMPNGNLLFECRYRWSGYGDSYLREYNADTQTWTLVGRYVQGEDVSPDACAYINGMTYDKTGNLHVTWCWRDDFGGGSNHDFYYAYSEDDGRTWKDTYGDHKATTQLMDPVHSTTTGTSLGQTKKSYMVEAIGYNRGYINQETQDVDSRGRIHAVNSHIPDGQGTDSNWGNSRTKARLHHRFRKEDGTWVKRLITVNGQSVNSIRRVNLAIDSFDNAYVVANGFGVIMASPADDYANWTLISEDGKSGFVSEPLSDRPLLKNKGVLSFVYLSAKNEITVFDYLTNNPQPATGTGLLAEYFAGTNYSNLISSEVVATPDQSTVPTGTQSIRWSGSFETRLGEAYTLHLNTADRADVYVNDRLVKIISDATTAQEHDINFSLIASHRNNIVIQAVTSSPLTLSWSGANTAKQVIPATSLYPEKANDAPGTATPPVLSGKAELEDVLLGGKQIFNTTEKQMLTISPFDPPRDYSLEVKTRVNAAVGRGLDIEARSKTGMGFRVSLDPTSINWTSELTNQNEIAIVDNLQEQVYRFAVENDKVHIYREKEYIGTRDLVLIKDIQANDQEAEVAGTFGADIMGAWAGPNGTGTAAPTAYGWSSTIAVPWNVVGGGSGVRYEQVTHALEAGGTFSGRLMTIRWDGAPIASAVYMYPVTLEANSTYELSFLYEYWSNATSAQTITAGISKNNTAADIYNTQNFVTSANAQRLRRGIYRFTSEEAGQYYLTFNGTYAMYGIGDFSLRSVGYESKMQVGKNYNDGSLNAEVHYVSYQEGAYAAAEEDVVDVPDLTVKAILPTLVQDALTINAATGAKSIQTLDFNPYGDYSVELSATVSSAVGRGLDLEARDGMGKGFRTALSTESFRWASPLAAMRQISRVDAEKQVIRYAVQSNQVHIYRNGVFEESFDLAEIGTVDATGGVEEPLQSMKPTNFYDGINLITNPDFKDDAHNAAPTGWTSDKAMGTSPNPRIQEKSGTTELSAYPDGKKAFMFRFDDNGGTYYAYRVDLKTNKWHEFSFDLITWGENQNQSFDVVVATTPDASQGVIATQTVTTPAVRATANRQVVRFYTGTMAAVPNANYYLIFKKKGTVGTIATTDLYLKEGGINSLLFGKNYSEGAAQFDIDYIRVDYSGAYAPDSTDTALPGTPDESLLIYSHRNEVHLRQLPAGAQIRIFDIMGRTVVHQQATSDRFSTTLPGGVYIVRVNNQIQKVLVQ